MEEAISVNSVSDALADLKTRLLRTNRYEVLEQNDVSGEMYFRNKGFAVRILAALRLRKSENTRRIHIFLVGESGWKQLNGDRILST